jgi:hypothetical protein
MHIKSATCRKQIVFKNSTNHLKRCILLLFLIRQPKHLYSTCMSIHSSSANSLAELRFCGSHCSIFRIKRRKHSLSLPSRFVSLSSSGLGSGRGIPAQNSSSNGVLKQNKDPLVAQSLPSTEKNLPFRFARARRLCGGGPSRAIISAR